MRLIDADILKNNLSDKNLITWTHEYGDAIPVGWVMRVIDNAPELGYEDGILSVENAARRAIELEDAYNNGWSDGFSEGEDERPQGKWILNQDENPECPFCHHSFTYWGNFCGNCGSDMRGGAE